jgi:hypothetical protein
VHEEGRRARGRSRVDLAGESIPSRRRTRAVQTEVEQGGTGDAERWVPPVNEIERGTQKLG